MSNRYIKHILINITLVYTTIQVMPLLSNTKYGVGVISLQNQNYITLFMYISWQLIHLIQVVRAKIPLSHWPQVHMIWSKQIGQTVFLNLTMLVLHPDYWRLWSTPLCENVTGVRSSTDSNHSRGRVTQEPRSKLEELNMIQTWRPWYQLFCLALDYPRMQR